MPRWTRDTTLGIIGIALGIAGLAFAYYTWRDTKLTKQILYSIDTKQIFSPTQSIGAVWSIPDDNVSAADRDVYESRVTLWNAGNATIEQKDFRSPISISGMDKDKVAKIIVSGGTNITAHRPIIKIFNKEAQIDYPLFDPGMSVVINVYHFGTNIGVGYKFGPGVELRERAEHVNKVQLYVLLATFSGIGFVIVVMFSFAGKESKAKGGGPAGNAGILTACLVGVVLASGLTIKKYMADPPPPGSQRPF